MNSRRFPSPRKPLWELRFTTQTPSLTLARPKIRLARIEPTKPAGAGVVVRVIKNVAKKIISLIHIKDPTWQQLGLVSLEIREYELVNSDFPNGDAAVVYHTYA
ncbi:hypothetical protein AVEN_192680-1 [Araneus ventricosus]|uniref:Uncharacterized protein n=1 Tax=Araneus ventricosus TaxID=182803 RepID=A0A4Y2MCV1_ARAVE|nr:hypothetical protein AVEN_192680-1 [Araneus ventricosus]